VHSTAPLPIVLELSGKRGLEEERTLLIASPLATASLRWICPLRLASAQFLGLQFISNWTFSGRAPHPHGH
jgi:hypothetical protein